MFLSKEELNKIKGIIDQKFGQLAEGIFSMPPDAKTSKVWPKKFEKIALLLEFLSKKQAKAGKLSAPILSAAENMCITTLLWLEKKRAESQQRVWDILKNANRVIENSKISEGAGIEEAAKQSGITAAVQQLRDSSGEGSRDWALVVATEISELLGAAAVQRIVLENVDSAKSTDDIIVYRIPVNDEATCKWCKQFYLQEDGTPKLYRLSTLLSGGSNFKVHNSSWKPVVGATHPNTRTSAPLQLPRGWKVLPGGGQEFIGFEEWDEYVRKNAR